ncbi:hypothetical protein TIFTF001_005391 [Ficus carica]|uniref:Uncharacterized protein n=1 Tax=Ficus carica TaxID=3494 RepID=A0AA87ZES0_FICCA|nr:hypothetical protein TIFTF001_005391 [Ficus carica]
MAHRIRKGIAVLVCGFKERNVAEQPAAVDGGDTWSPRADEESPPQIWIQLQ